MKTLKITLFVMLCTIIHIHAQTPPTPPTPPRMHTHTDVTSSVNNATSISNSDKTYKFTARFERDKREGIINILRSELREMELIKSNKRYLWKSTQGGKIVFECKLSQNKLRLYIDKSKHSFFFIRKIKNLGNELRTYITAHKSFAFHNRARSIKEAQTRVDRAKAALERAVIHLERMKRGQ